VHADDRYPTQHRLLEGEVQRGPVVLGPADADDDVLESLLTVAHDRGQFGEIWELAERLLDHDANAALWRSRHVIMVERQIGTKSGTGGSSGAPYLRGRLGLHYYPLLWELRSQL